MYRRLQALAARAAAISILIDLTHRHVGTHATGIPILNERRTDGNGATPVALGQDGDNAYLCFFSNIYIE